MYEEQRYGLGVVALLVEEMNVQRLVSINGDLGLEMGQFVDFSLLFLPVEFILPVFRQSFDISQRRAIVPSGIIQLVWEVGQCQLGS